MNYLRLFTLIFLAVICFAACTNKNGGQTKNRLSQHIPALLERGEKIQNGKEWELVQSNYQRNNLAIQESADNPNAFLNLAHIFVLEARVTGEHGHYYPAALEMTDRVIEKNYPNKDLIFQALSTKAGVLLSLHEFEKALTVANQAYKLYPNNAQILGVLVDCYVELGDYKNAIVLADKMVMMRPDIRSYARVSYLREIYGDIQGAEEAMLMAIEAGYPGQEETAWAMYTLGEFYLKYNDLAKAEQLFKAILKERDNYPFAKGGLAEVEYQRGNLENATSILDEAISIIPEVGFYIQKAQIKKDIGDRKSCQTLLEEIFLMLDDDVQAGHNMNLEYAALHRDLTNDLDTALQYALTEYEKRPNNIDVNQLLTSIYVKQANDELANFHHQKASVTGAKHPNLLSAIDKK